MIHRLDSGLHTEVVLYRIFVHYDEVHYSTMGSFKVQAKPEPPQLKISLHSRRPKQMI